jgi:CheY-like chemotaxis protein
LAQQATTNSKHAGKRLLIADDDTDMRLLLAEYFRRLGFQVEERESGMAALEATLTGRFDCFIFDVSMPGMSGIELLKRVRDRGILTTISPSRLARASSSIELKPCCGVAEQCQPRLTANGSKSAIS